MSLKGILAFIGLCVLAPGVYYRVVAPYYNITETNPDPVIPKNSAPDDGTRTLPIMDSELSSVIVFKVRNERVNLSTLKKWIECVGKNPNVEKSVLDVYGWIVYGHI
jgi:hypothetical protein